MILDHQINLVELYYYYHRNINKVYDRSCFITIITIIINNKNNYNNNYNINKNKFSSTNADNNENFI